MWTRGLFRSEREPALSEAEARGGEARGARRVGAQRGQRGEQPSANGVPAAQYDQVLACEAR